MPEKVAELYRMVMPGHICPFGLKALDLLQREGFKVDDHHLASKAETEAFKQQHQVKTTPQAFIDGKRIGGYSDLSAYFGKPLPDTAALNYRPVIVVFAMAALIAAAISWAAFGELRLVRFVEWFIAVSMCILALLKLQDLESFTNMFLGYDLLARRYVPYAYIYPFAEAIAGVLMVAGALEWISIPLALIIGTIGAVSVVQAVYVEKRSLKCACVGGNSNVPLGFVSLTENLMMVAMALWMLAH